MTLALLWSRLPPSRSTFFCGIRRTCPLYADLPLQAALIFGGLPLIIALARQLVALEFGSDLLAGISILTVVLLREYLVGAIVVLARISCGISLVAGKYPP